MPTRIIQIELSEERLATLEALIQEGGLRVLQDVFNNAMQLLDWAAAEARGGRDIASLNEALKEYEILHTPMLDHIKNRAGS